MTFLSQLRARSAGVPLPTRLLQLAVLVALAADPAAAQPPPAADTGAPAESEDPQPFIPPGHEELLAAMLGAGAALPGDCKFAGGAVQHTVAKGTYACSGGEVMVELAHPSRAGRDAVVTEEFAITATRGTPPPELIPALAARVREREGEFEWQWTAGRSGDAGAAATSWILPLAILSLFGLALLGWLLRRRATPGPG